MKVPDTSKIIQAAYLIGFVIILFVVYKIMTGIGLIKTPAKKKLIAAKEKSVNELRTTDIFDPSFMTGKKFVPLGEKLSEDYAVILRKAVRGLGTDEEAIFSIFGRLKNKINVSEISAVYRIKYKDDLQTDILNELNENEVLELWNIINNLPNN